jgi:hypothetical protein
MIRDLKSEVEKLKNEKSIAKKSNNDLTKLLKVYQKSCKKAAKVVVDVGVQEY